MGVDYWPCEECGETFPDCGTYESCDCGKVWCCEKCAKKGGLASIDGPEEDEDEGARTSTCSYCRGENVTDEELLAFLLKHTKLTRPNAVKLCLKAIK